MQATKIDNLNFLTDQPVAIASGFGFYAIIVKLFFNVVGDHGSKRLL